MASRTRKAAEAAPTDESTAKGTDVTPADNATEQDADVTAQDHEAGQDGTSVNPRTGESTVGGAETPVEGEDSVTGEPGAVATPNGEVVGGVSADGFTTEANAPVTAPTVAHVDRHEDGTLSALTVDATPKSTPVNERGQTVDEARTEAQRASDPEGNPARTVAYSDAAPLLPPSHNLDSEKARQTSVVQAPEGAGESVPAGIPQAANAAAPLVRSGARLVDEDGNDVDPGSVFEAVDGPQTVTTVKQRVFVRENAMNSTREVQRLLFPKGARVARITAEQFKAEWASK